MAFMMKNNLNEIKFYENGKNIAKAFDWVFQVDLLKRWD